MENNHEEKEILVLLKYFEKHNLSHSEELNELLGRMEKENFSPEVCKLVKEALVDYHSGNEKLSAALKLLDK